MANNLGAKWKMNSLNSFNECFNIGSTVSCRTCYHKEIEGEVLAFDAPTKILILKCSPSDGKPPLCDINFVNLNFVSDVQVVKEASSSPPTPQSLNTDRLTNRLKNNVSSKKRVITALQSGVSPEGQNLFLTITKTIEDVKWEGPDIVVFENVKITPPYKPENVQASSSSDTKACNHLRKLVDKHAKDWQSSRKEAQSPSNNSSCASNASNSNHNCASPLPQ
ncbi:hypothetical protein V9T40_004101 [Parthenolecanium corni]|uniref:AD domain-containing protein n=1 Tax=Parthenolecanium corni TaxID=536013 RepID=A0AAN9TIQ4_9HEMI